MRHNIGHSTEELQELIIMFSIFLVHSPMVTGPGSAACPSECPIEIVKIWRSYRILRGENQYSACRVESEMTQFEASAVK